MFVHFINLHETYEYTLSRSLIEPKKPEKLLTLEV